MLDTTTVTLAQALSWKVGSRLDLFATPASLVELRCGDVLLFRGLMGRKGEKIAVRIEQKLET